MYTKLGARSIEISIVKTCKNNNRPESEHLHS
jgi:hypothetical protein